MRRPAPAARGMEPVLEGRDDPEVAAAAAQAPEQVGYLALARGHEAAVGGDNVRRDQVVAGKAVLALGAGRCRRRASGPRCRCVDGTARSSKAEHLRLAVKLAPRQARLRAHVHMLGRRGSPSRAERWISRPPSHRAFPATLWPPARIASSRSWARPKPSAALTSATPCSARPRRAACRSSRCGACAPRRSPDRPGRSRLRVAPRAVRPGRPRPPRRQSTPARRPRWLIDR